MRDYKCVKDLTHVVECSKDWTPIKAIRCEYEDILRFSTIQISDEKIELPYKMSNGYIGVIGRKGKRYLLDLSDWEYCRSPSLGGSVSGV